VFAGLALAVWALALASWLTSQPLLGALGAWLAIIAAIAVVQGPSRARFFAPSLTPLWLIVPLTRDWPAWIEGHLQLASAAIAELWLGLLGVAVLRRGEMLYTPRFWNEVDDTCSGIATISTLAVFALIMGLILRLSNGPLAMVAALAMPLGLLLNGARIAAVSMLGESGGVDLAAGA
jgi:exosortase/archaeosortase family protein